MKGNKKKKEKKEKQEEKNNNTNNVRLIGRSCSWLLYTRVYTSWDVPLLISSFLFHLFFLSHFHPLFVHVFFPFSSCSFIFFPPSFFLFLLSDMRVALSASINLSYRVARDYPTTSFAHLSHRDFEFREGHASRFFPRAIDQPASD